jgi:hypothetical protein
MQQRCRRAIFVFSACSAGIRSNYGSIGATRFQMPRQEHADLAQHCAISERKCNRLVGSALAMEREHSVRMQDPSCTEKAHSAWVGQSEGIRTTFDCRRVRGLTHFLELPMAVGIETAYRQDDREVHEAKEFLVPASLRAGP